VVSWQLLRLVTVTILLVHCVAGLRAQGNYEVQVYASELTPKGVTMVELHSNITAKGTKGVIDGVLPTDHAVHETLEITRGFNEWFETGFYQFTSIQPDGSWKWVGTHVRPRISIPERYKLPVGLSLSMEFGYQRPNFDQDTWTWEIRPIIDKQLGKFYMSFNPTFDKSFHGPSKSSGYEFAPNVKFAYEVSKKLAMGLEYYGAYGPYRHWSPLREQQQAFLPAIDVDFGKNWEFNFGVGVGVTAATDHLLVKMIVGYRFNNKNK
jgi:Putative MetA-pathway of phenol degradation